MQIPVKDLGETTSLDVLNDRVALPKKNLLDVGCGDMTFSRQLVESGATVLAIDPDATQAEINRQQPALDRLKFEESTVDELQLEDNSLDGIVFSFSLHHIPGPSYPVLFEKLFRLLREDGFLLVIEPATSKLYNVMKMFHDEDEVRDEAQRALAKYALPRFEMAESLTYHSYFQYDDWEHFATRFASKAFNELYTEADIRRPEVRQAFEEAGSPDYRFLSPKVTMFLSGLRPS